MVCCIKSIFLTQSCAWEDEYYCHHCKACHPSYYLQCQSPYFSVRSLGKQSLKCFVLDADNLIPKVAPQHFTGAENIEGNGGPGTIKKITFAEGNEFKYMKHKVEEIDHANFKYSYSIIEGGPLGHTLEKISYEIKMVAAPHGGSILKITSKYHTKGDASINEEEIKAGKEKAAGLFKAVEAYLLAHPDTYC